MTTTPATPTNPTTPPPGHPGRHPAWTILATCFGALLVAQGVRLSFGAFVLPFEERFDASRGAVSAVGAASYIVYGVLQPVVGRLVDRVDVRRLFVTGVAVLAAGLALAAAAPNLATLALAYAGVASVGFGVASSVATSVLVARWFEAKRGMAFGILEAGFGAGQLVLVPTSILVIDRFGFRTTLAAYAVVLVVAVAPLSLRFLRNRPEDLGLEPLGGHAREADGTRTVLAAAPTIGAIVARREFWFLVLPFLVCGITTTGMIDTHLIAFAHDHGNSDGLASAAVSTLALFNIVGTAGSGLLVDRYDPRRILGTLYLLRAVSLLVVLGLNEGFWLLQFSVLFGLVDFATVAPTQTLVSRYFGANALGFTFGLILASHQIGSALGSWLPGLVYDSTGSYTGAFVVSAATLVGASALSLLLPDWRRPATPPTGPEPAPALA